MPEIIGDVVMPTELIIADKTGDAFTNEMTLSGAHIFLSGAALYYIENKVLHEITKNP